MRFLVLLMFFPALASAQPASITPASVIGFLRLDMNKDRVDERVLLTLDRSGVIDLYIQPENASAPVVYFEAFSATNGTPPALLATDDGGFEVAQWMRHGQGSTYFSERINWVEGENAGYYTIGLTLRFYPRDENADVIDCTVDFLNGRLETTINEGAMQVMDVNMPPTPPGAPLPAGWDELCDG